MLALMEPKLIYHINLTKQYKLLQSLIDLDIRNSDEKQALCEQYREILDNQKTITENYKKDPTLIERLYGLLTDLYIDRFKFKGINVKNKIEKLIELLDNYDRETLVKFYNGK